MNSTRKLTDDNDVAGWPARLFLTVFMAAWVFLHVGCASVRPDGSKARIGDGVVTTRMGEIPLGDILDRLQPVLEDAGKYDPKIALAARLIGGRDGKDDSPKGATKTTRMTYEGKAIDPALLVLEETWERKSTFKPTMQVVGQTADTNAINAAVEKIMGSGIVNEVPR